MYLTWLGIFTFMFLVQVSYDCDHENDGGDTDEKCTSELGFGVFVAVCSMLFVIMHFLTKLPQVADYCGLWNTCAEPSLGTFLFFLWLSAVMTLTFPEDGQEEVLTPYMNANGGYFMVWSAFVVSTMFIYPKLGPTWKRIVEKFSCLKMVGTADERSTVLLTSHILLSLALLWSASYNCEKDNVDCTHENGWAIVCPMFSIVFTSVLLLFGKCFHMMQNLTLATIYGLLVVWWFFGVVYITIKGPFDTPSNRKANGFFATWACFILAVALLGTELGFVKVDRKTNPDF